jgi:hypothetical protein
MKHQKTPTATKVEHTDSAGNTLQNRTERGEIAAWVLIVIMTAGLVAFLWPLAQDYLGEMLGAAMDLVRP